MSEFQGAKIGDKEFPFVRITIAKQAKYIKRFQTGLFTKFCEIFFSAKNNTRMWKRVRSLAFVRDWKWKYLRIIPKELRCSEISLRLAGEIQASFFDYVREEVTAHDKRLLSVTGLKTENEPKK